MSDPSCESVPAPERRDLREVVADALWTADEGYGWNMTTEAREDYLVRADLVIAALGLEQIGWGGVSWDEVEPLPAEDFDEADGVPDGEVWRREGDDVLIWNAGDWTLRHEDGEGDLVDPWPIYRLKEATDDT